MLNVLEANVREGRGPWRPVKRAARCVLSFHIPVAGPTRAVFGLAYRFHVGAAELSRWALRLLWFEPLFRSRCAAVGPGFRMESLPYVRGAGRIVIGRDVRLSGKPTVHFSARYGRPPELVIDDGAFVGHGCAFHVGRSVRIGRHCLLAGGVQVFDLDGHPLDAAGRRAGRPAPASAVRPVEIGDDVWVGTGALILKGVTVGPRSVIAARAVVTGDVPPDVVVAGNPARIVHRLTPTDRARLAESPDWDAAPLEAVT